MRWPLLPGASPSRCWVPDKVRARLAWEQLKLMLLPTVLPDPYTLPIVLANRFGLMNHPG